MTESILNSIKLDIGVTPEDTSFDSQIIEAINSSFSILFMRGVGSKDKPFKIEDENQVWEEFEEDNQVLASVRTFVYERTQLIVDPPTNATLVEVKKEIANEAGFYSSVYAEHREVTE